MLTLTLSPEIAVFILPGLHKSKFGQTVSTGVATYNYGFGQNVSAVMAAYGFTCFLLFFGFFSNTLKSHGSV